MLGVTGAVRAGGFGFCAMDGETIAGWCTAEYVSEGQCGIGIETIEAYQGRGVATALAGAFVDQCGERGITAHWDSWAANTPSVKVAARVGFTRVEEYAVYLGRWE